MTPTPEELDAIEAQLRRDCYCADIHIVTAESGSKCRPCKAVNALSALRLSLEAAHAKLAGARELLSEAEEWVANCDESYTSDIGERMDSFLAALVEGGAK